MRLNTTVNGEARQVDDVWEGESLLYVLRERLGLPGSKNACEQGECGSCTVYLDGVTVCACLVAAGQAEGREVRTVEGLAGRADARRDPAGLHRCRRGAVRLLHARPDRGHPRPARAAVRTPRWPRSARRWPATCAGAPATSRSSRRSRRPPRPGPGRERRMIVLEGGHVATVDAAGTEYPSGHVVIDGNALVAVGPGPAPDELRDGAQRVDATGCLVTPGPGEHPPPPLPVADPRVRRGQHPVRLADRAVPDLGPAGRRRGARRRLGQPGLAGAVRVQHQHRPPLRVSRNAADLLDATIEAALEIGVRFHPCRGSMDLGSVRRRAAAGRGGRGPGGDPDRHRGGHRPLARPVAGGDDPDRGGALLAVLGDRRADARGRRAGPRQGRPAAHPPRRDAGRGGVLPADLWAIAGRVPGRAGLAGPGRVAGALRAPVRCGDRQPGRHRHRGGALPDVQRPARAPAAPGCAT